METTEIEHYKGMNAYQLSLEASKLLAGEGLNLWGKPKPQDNYKENRFHRRIKLGAYCSQSDSRRRR